MTTLMPETKSPAYSEDELSMERHNKSAAGAKDSGGGETLERVQDVAGQQCENCHHQDGFQLFVVRAGTTKVVA